MLFGSTAIGVDLGSHSIKIVWLHQGLGGKALLRSVILERSRMESQTDAGAPASRLGTALKANLLAMGLKVRDVSVGISGREMIFRLVRMPATTIDNLTLLASQHAQEMAAGAAGGVAFDFRLVNVPTPNLRELVTLLAVAKQSVVQDRLALLAASGIGVASLSPQALALFNAYRLSSPQAEESALLLDIGESTTEAVVVRTGHLIFARGFSPAGREFTEGVRQAVGVSAAKAEEIKCKDLNLAASAGGERRGRSEAVEAARSVAQQFAAAVQSTLQLARAQARVEDLRVQRVLLSGGGARLRGLREYLANALHLEVQPLDPFSGVRLPASVVSQSEDLTALPTTLAGAIGLAAGRFSPDPQLDLMPQEVLRQRQFARRGVFGLAGGILLVVAAGLLTFGAFEQERAEQKTRVTLLSLKDQAERRRHELENLRAENQRLARGADLLAASTRPGLAFFDCAKLIRDTIPESITLTKIEELVNTGPRDGDQSLMPETVLVVSGQVKNPDRPATQVLDDFVKALSGKDPKDPSYPIAEVGELTATEGLEDTRDPVKARVLKFSFKIRPRPM